MYLAKELKKPISKTDQFSLEINKFYTDVNGTIIDKTTVVNALKTSFPFYLFNEYDLKGSYKIGQYVAPPKANTFYLYTYIQGSFFNWFEFNPANDVKNFIKPGDIVHLYADSISTPTVLIFVVLSCPFQSIASIILNTLKNPIKIDRVLYFSNNVLNFNEPIYVVTINEIGIHKSDVYNPLEFKSIDYASNQNFIELKIKPTLNPNFGLYSYIDYLFDKLSFEFKVIL